MNTDLTRHAEIRVQQRGVDALTIELLQDYGSEMPCGDGCSKRYFDKRARRRIAADKGRKAAALLAPLFGTYLIEDRLARVVTVGHRTKRLRRR